MKTLITGDETWVYSYDVEMNVQSSQWVEPNSLQLKKKNTSSIKLEDDVHCFFYHSRVIHHEFMPQHQAVNKEFYVQILRCLREECAGRGPTCGKARAGCCITTMLQVTCLVGQYLAPKELAVLPHPPCSPDLAPAGFFPVPRVENHPERTSFSECRQDKSNFIERATLHLRKRVTKCIPTVAEVMGTVCCK